MEVIDIEVLLETEADIDFTLWDQDTRIGMV